MEKEIDIIELIKSRRFFKLALKHLLTKEMRMQLKERSRYLLIDPEKETTSTSIERSNSNSQGAKKGSQINLTDGFYSSQFSQASSQEDG